MNRVLTFMMMTLLIASAFPLNATADATDDIPTNAAGTGEHGSLLSALTYVGLNTTLEGTGPFTVFAPTDQAFDDAGIDLANFQTQEEKDMLTDILLYHVVTASVPSSAVTDGMLATMANGDKAKFAVNGGTVSIGTATVTTADVQSSNGIIHVIDQVLMPPEDIPATASSTGIHNSLVSAVLQAELLPTLEGPGPFTVFAPTDQAFAEAGIDLAALDNPQGKATLQDILLYHVISEEVPSTNISDCMTTVAANGQPVSFSLQNSVKINDANITMTDVVSSNGIIHVIDKVLTPTDNPNDIPRTAQCTGIHDALVAGVIQAELLETLQGPGPFTIFAPTDQAFADAGIDLGALDNPTGKQTLSDILLYHVVSGEVPSSNVTECMTATAVNGQTLSFTVAGGVMVNGANVTLADVGTSNGVIHVIDKVLTPSDTPNDIPRTAQCTGIHDSLVSAVVQAELLETLQGTGPFTLFAPTDQAFADAGIDLAALDNPAGKEALTDILLYHVVSGNVPSTALSDCMTAPAVNGQTLSFNLGSGVMVNDANVTLADVGTSNGVIHVIDKVLSPTDTPNDIPRTAQCSGVHNSLVSSIVQAELLETLQGDGPFTVFAPTDQAFADAGIDLAALDNPDGKQTLTDILLYHVVSGAVPAANVTDCMSASTVNGNPLSFTVGGTVMVNGATVTATDLSASNGIIHVIDKVLMPTATPNDIPRTAQCTGIHDSLVAAVIQAELLETLQGEGPFTVFAPTDQAFADAGIDLAALDTVEGKAALSDILLYHVVPSAVPSTSVMDCMDASAANGQTLSFTVGSSVMVNDATVTLADVATSNGIIHVIDKVLSPTNTPNDIARTAQCTGVHSSLVAALAQAELVETLQGEGPFTVFAPTDQAFADAGIDLASLDTPEGKETLTDILLYHVVSGAVPASAVEECGGATAVNGQPLAFTVGDSVMVNDATVSIADVNTSNGVIHVIDKVLMPTDTPNDTVRTASCTGAHTSLVAALIQAELVETLEGEGPFTVFAPSDQAFADAGIDLASFDSVSGKENLTGILLYHVYAGTFTAADIIDGNILQMVNGDNATISASPGINDAGIVTADVFTSNGVIHVIDKVLMPPVPEVEVPVDDENETNEGEGTGDGTSSDEDEDSGWMTYLYIGLGILVLAGVGALLFMRREGDVGDISKDFAQGGLSNPMSMSEGTIFTAQPSSGQTTATSYATQAQASYPAQTVAAAQPTYQAQAVAQPAYQAQPVAAQPVVAEPQVAQQWTDDAGHTWRQMDDGSMLWWNGTDWQPAA